MRQVAPTKVSFNALVRAMGGSEPHDHEYRVWVQCPADYDPAEITADDIICDPAIAVWETE